jgi:hypothetical protein
MALNQNVSYTPYFIIAETRWWINTDRGLGMKGDSFPTNSKYHTNFNAVMKHLPCRRDITQIFIPLTNENFIHKEIKKHKIWGMLATIQFRTFLSSVCKCKD